MVAAMVLLVPSAVLATGEFNLFYGQKQLDENDWEPLETQQAIGLELTFNQERAVGIAIDFFLSEDDGRLGDETIEAETRELDAGVRSLFRKARMVQPFIGGGIAYIDGEIRIEGSGLGDEDIGLWLATGVLFRIGEHFNLGVDLRASSAKIKFGAIDLNAGGIFAGVLLGTRWGR
jgi:hypothetical protein